MTHLNITGGHRLTGRCQVPGDKSISHRAVMFSAIANGVSTVRVSTSTSQSSLLKQRRVQVSPLAEVSSLP